jgi:hypothetical protein
MKIGKTKSRREIPAWCYQAGQPAQAAAMKCSRAAGENKAKKREEEKTNENI